MTNGWPWRPAGKSVIGHSNWSFLEMFASIYLPDFALQCVLRHEPDLRRCALAVVDGGLPARIRQRTPAAGERGVTAGMTTTQALGRCPTLLFRTVGESLLAPASALLLQCAENFSPWIEATGEGVATIEWRDEFQTQRRGGVEGIDLVEESSNGDELLRRARSSRAPAEASRLRELSEPVNPMLPTPPEASPEGAKYASPGQRPGFPERGEPALKGRHSLHATPLEVRHGGTPRPALGTSALPGNLHARAQEIVAQLTLCGFTAQVGVAASPDLALLAAQAACGTGLPAREKERLGLKARDDRLEACPTTARAGASPSDPAWLAAHVAASIRVVETASEFLTPLPLEALAADGEISRSEMDAKEWQAARAYIFRMLHRWGIHTLGAFGALPREQVVARLGGPAGELWDRAAGRAERPLRLVRAPEIFAEAMELEHEVETMEPLLFVLRRFLDQLATRLAAAYRVAATLELRLTFRDGTAHAHALRIPAPTRDVDVLFRVLSTHLESVTAAAPIVAVALSVQAARPEQQQFSLFESGLRDPNKFFETLARLHALLGHDRVGTPVAEDTHRPDAFHIETPRFDEQQKSEVRSGRSEGGSRKSEVEIGSAHSRSHFPLPEAPLQRYRPPLHADVQMIDGRPAHVFSEKAFGAVSECRGPWLGSGDWWAERAWEREEWDVQVGETCYRLAQQAGAWVLDGAYD